MSKSSWRLKLQSQCPSTTSGIWSSKKRWGCFLVFVHLILGVCDCDDHKACGKEQEEGSPVLARRRWGRSPGSCPGSGRRLQSGVYLELLSGILLPQASKISFTTPLVGHSLYGSPTEVCEKWFSYTLRSGQTWQHLKSPGKQNSRGYALPGCCWIWCTRRTPCRRSTGRQTENQVCTGFCPSVLLIIPRHNLGALQCWSWKNGNLPGGVQALARLHQPQREGALRLPHCARSEEATVPNGPEERAIRLHC